MRKRFLPYVTLPYRPMLVFILMIACAQPSSATVTINELMYNPAGDEFDFEYIELYGEGENISLWSFEGIDFTFPQNTTINGYLVVANTLNDSGENNDFRDRYPNTSCNFEFTGNLLNTGETIILRDSANNIVDVVTYDDWSVQNHSIERISTSGYSSDPNNWKESRGTPGKENSAIAGCDWAISVIMNSSVSPDPSWQIRATKLAGDTKANITIALWVEDAFGATVRNYSAIIIENALTQSTSSTYTPSLSPKEGYFIKANMTNLSCTDNNQNNNYVSELIFVHGLQVSTSNSSSIVIKDIDDQVTFGDTAHATVAIYRGDTAKYAITAFIGGKAAISDTTTFHALNKFTNYTLKIPVQLKPNCDNRYDEGTYDFTIEGLDSSDKKNIRIAGIKSSLCKEIKTQENRTSKRAQKSMNYELLSNQSSLIPGQLANLDVKVTGDEKEHLVDVWAYLYRGPKTYADAQKKTLRLKPFAEEKAVLPLFVNKTLHDGKYKLKVLFRKDGQKTTKDVVHDVLVQVPLTTETKNSNACPSPPETSTFEQYANKPGIIIYESSSMKAQEIAPILFSTALLLLVIVLVFKKI